MKNSSIESEVSSLFLKMALGQKSEVEHAEFISVIANHLGGHLALVSDGVELDNILNHVCESIKKSVEIHRKNPLRDLARGIVMKGAKHHATGSTGPH